MGLVRNNGEYIHIVDPRVDHGGFGLIVLQHIDFILDPLRFFKFHLLGVQLHLLFKRLNRALEVSFYDLPNGLNLIVIVFLNLQTFAGSRAISQVIVQTNLIFSRIYLFLRKVIITGAERIKAFYQIQQCTDRLHTSVGAIVL